MSALRHYSVTCSTALYCIISPRCTVLHFFTTLRYAALLCSALLDNTDSCSTTLYYITSLHWSMQHYPVLHYFTTLKHAALHCYAFLHHKEACSTTLVPWLLTLFCSSMLLGSTQPKNTSPTRLLDFAAWNSVIMPISFGISASLVKCKVELEPEIELVHKYLFPSNRQYNHKHQKYQMVCRTIFATGTFW